jgi:hypothetical protein
MQAGFGSALMATIISALLAITAPASASASTPSLVWTDARRVAINCLVQSRTSSDAAALQDELCARIVRLARAKAPIPVSRATTGDAAILSPGTVTLLVHLSVERAASGRTIVFTIRPYRASNPDAHVLFGTAPRVVHVSSRSTGTGLDPALMEALVDILPWRAAERPFARPL